MKKKEQSCTVGEMIDLLLEMDFKREDIIVIENSQGNEKLVWDIGRSYCVNDNKRKLIVSMRK